jgi:RimJ/RimL family protein N-acetyltransferase
MQIETERLLLRPLRVEDLEDMLALDANPEVSRFIPGKDREQALRWLQNVETDWDEHGHGIMAIVDAASGRFVGRTGLKYWPQFGEVEVGWVLDPGVWGRGLATEAGRACAEWGFAHLTVPYLTAMIRADNERSIRVAERLGMTPLRPDVLNGIPLIVHYVRREAWEGSGEG